VIKKLTKYAAKRFCNQQTNSSNISYLREAC